MLRDPGARSLRAAVGGVEKKTVLIKYDAVSGPCWLGLPLGATLTAPTLLRSRFLQSSGTVAVLIHDIKFEDGIDGSAAAAKLVQLLESNFGANPRTRSQLPAFARIIVPLVTTEGLQMLPCFFSFGDKTERWALALLTETRAQGVAPPEWYHKMKLKTSVLQNLSCVVGTAASAAQEAMAVLDISDVYALRKMIASVSGLPALYSSCVPLHTVLSRPPPCRSLIGPAKRLPSACRSPRARVFRLLMARSSLRNGCRSTQGSPVPLAQWPHRRWFPRPRLPTKFPSCQRQLRLRPWRSGLQSRFALVPISALPLQQCEFPLRAPARVLLRRHQRCRLVRQR